MTGKAAFEKCAWWLSTVYFGKMITITGAVYKRAGRSFWENSEIVCRKLSAQVSFAKGRIVMILGEKIASLRKRNHWSQEELAEQLGISRQSVSKWESGASIPDLDKILRLSTLFDVTTDYLLKDDMEEELPTELGGSPAEDSIRVISVETAHEFMEATVAFSQKISLGISLCIFAPVLLIVLEGISQTSLWNFSGAVAEGIGGTVLFLLVAVGVALLITQGITYSKYEYLEKEVFETEYGVTGIVEREKDSFSATHRRNVAGGVVLCIVSVIPALVLDEVLGSLGHSALGDGIGGAILLTVVAVGVNRIVRVAIIQGGFQRLLQEGEYTAERKLMNKKTGPFSGIYWCIVVAIYLAVSFIGKKWEISWAIFPVAGVFYAALHGVLELILKKE